MNASRLGLWLGALAPLAVLARASAPDERAFVELESPRETCFVHEAVPLVLRLGVEVELLRERALQPFRRRLDVPVEVRLARAGAHEGWRLLPLAAQPSAPAAGPSFALDDALTRAHRASEAQRDGRTFTVLEHDLRIVADSPGELRLPAPRLHLVHASGFREDFLEGRVALDRQVLELEGSPLHLLVLPLPEEGRPADFSGGVGRFELRAELEQDTVALGESVRVTLTLEGRGELARVEPPHLADLAGFHLYGLLEEDLGSQAPRPTRRRWTYDLAPRSVEVTEVPPIRLAYFDPEPPGAYREARTGALALRVLPSPAGEALPAAESGEAGAAGRLGEPDARPSSLPQGAAPAPERGLPWAFLSVVVLLLSLAGVVVAQRRGQRRARRDEGEAASRAPRARADFERAVAEGRGPDAALAAYLARRLGVPPAAVIDPGLAERLTSGGLCATLAARSAALLFELVASRYGGPAAVEGVARARELVTELEHAFGSLPIERAAEPEDPR